MYWSKITHKLQSTNNPRFLLPQSCPTMEKEHSLPEKYGPIVLGMQLVYTQSCPTMDINT